MSDKKKEDPREKERVILVPVKVTEIHNKMSLRRPVGSGSYGDVKFDLSVGLPNMAPCIEIHKDGRWVNYLLDIQDFGLQIMKRHIGEVEKEDAE